MLLLVAFVVCFCQTGASAAASKYVLAPDQGDAIAEIMGRGAPLPDRCRFTGGAIELDQARVFYACDAAEIVLLLRPVAAIGWNAGAPKGLTLEVVAGAPPAALLRALESRVAERGSSLAWVSTTTPPQDLPWGLSIVAVVFCAFLWWHVFPAPITLVRAAGIVALAFVVGHSVPPLGAPDNLTLMRWGVLAVGCLYWLAATGAFGFAGVGRSDWVGLVPVAVGLLLREGVALHSVQEIEIRFVSLAIDKHSFVYPFLQLVYLPIAPDPHRLTMHLNGVLGAFACGFAYLFVRRRMQSRAAGVLAGLFLALHPAVARMAPTDGPDSLMLSSWFFGMALLASPPRSPWPLAGGALLVTAAATMRVEGAVYLLGSLLMSNPAVLLSSLRRHGKAGLAIGVVCAALIALHLALFLPANVNNVPTLPSLAALLNPETLLGRPYAACLVVGVLSPLLTGGWLGPGLFAASLLALAPVVEVVGPVTLHRLVPAMALQALLAGVGVYAVLVSWSRSGTVRSLMVTVGAALAAIVTIQNARILTVPYSFNQEYSLVRDNLAPAGGVRSDCALLTVPPPRDDGIHDFAQVLPGMRVLDCRNEDCLGAARSDECVYYVRAAPCYLHQDGVPGECRNDGRWASGGACLVEACQLLERQLALELVESREVGLVETFVDHGGRYPRSATLGLFRVVGVRGR